MMDENENELWQKIRAFEIDEPGIAFKFSERLARENGWTKAYAKKVIEEYKKFIFLCCIAAHGVTPSDPVDQAWHLHLTFTRSYWVDLCKNTLKREIHHIPTKGGQKEEIKFDGFYTGTHQLYTDKFGIQPPVEIWQDNHARFNDINFRRVNIGRYWLIRKPRLSVYSLIILMLFITCAVFIQASDTILSALLMLAIFTAIVIAVYKWESDPDRHKDNKDDQNGSGCSMAGSGCNSGDFGSHHSGGHHGHDGGGDSGCGSGCSGCSGSGCSGCGGGGD